MPNRRPAIAIRTLAFAAIAPLLAGCTPADPPPTPTALCAAFGYTAGTPSYADCVKRRQQDAIDRAHQDAVMHRLLSGSP